MTAPDVPVTWLNLNPDAPARGYWDQGMLEDLFANDLWQPAGHHVFTHIEDEMPPESGSVVVIPARQNAGNVDKINEILGKIKWALVILTGDEEGDFPVDKLHHPRMRIWLMTPQKGRDYGNVDTFIGTMYPPGLRQHIPEDPPVKDLDVFFSGQDTHQRRHDCIKIFKDFRNSVVTGTPGFIQGMDQEQYWDHLVRAKVAPAPGGPVSPDSFRLFEALEAGCIPIADACSGREEFPEFWEYIFGPDRELVELMEWRKGANVATAVMHSYPEMNNRVYNWWQHYKRDLAYKLRDRVNELSETGGHGEISDRVTVLVPSSPIPSHPGTEIIEETIESIRAQPELENAEIIVMLDGVRNEQNHRRKAYEEYARRLIWMCNNKWRNVIVQRHPMHMHQGMMTKVALDTIVQTEFILFVEQDTPLCDYIEWKGLAQSITDGHANVIRLHHEALILPDHEHLMIGSAMERSGVRMTRTHQWSQRPHLASTEWYKWMINTYFGDESRTMIEDVLYSVVETHYREEEMDGWRKFKLWIYTPDADHIKRSYHTDGRAGESKYTMVFAYDDEESAKFAPFAGEIDG